MRASECILQKIEKFENAVAQVDGETGRKLTYNDIIERSSALTRWLRSRGVGPKDVIVLMSKNNADYVWILLGIWNSGAACYLINPRFTLREILHALSLVSVKGLILEKGTFTTIFCPPMGEIKHVIEFGDNPNVELSDGVISMNKVLAAPHDYAFRAGDAGLLGPPNNDARLRRKSAVSSAVTGSELRSLRELEELENIPEDLALVLNSSGSSGLPKGVMLTHQNIIASLKLSKTFIEKGERAVGLMPYFHAYGLVLMLMCLYEGATVVNISKFSLPSLMKTIKEYSLTHLHIVPSLLVTLIKSSWINFGDLKSVQHVWTGAAPVGAKEQEDLKKKFQQAVVIHHSYGLTETTFTMFTGVSSLQKPGSPGRLIDSMQCKIVDLENNNVLKPGSVGEVCFKGPLLMKGYINNPKATAEAIDSEGWLHTGDLGYFDQDGYFFFVDRVKEIIKYQGYQVSTCELEFVLISHQWIQDAAVIGIEHKIYGQVPRAFVVSQSCPASDVTAQDIHDYMREMVAPYKLLRGGIVFVDSIPKTPSGKNQRAELRLMEVRTVFYDQKIKSR